MPSLYTRKDELLAKWLWQTKDGLLRRYQERHKLLDSIIVWVVGLSTAGIGFILSLSKLPGEIIPGVTVGISKISMALFITSVLSGVLGRTALHYYRRFQEEAWTRVEAFLNVRNELGHRQAPPKLEEASDGEILTTLASHFETSSERIVNNMTKEEIRSQYADFRERWIAKEHQGLKKLGRELGRARGTDPEDAAQMFLDNDSSSTHYKRIRTTKIIGGLMLLLSGLTFLGAVVVLGVAFVVA